MMICLTRILLLSTLLISMAVGADYNVIIVGPSNFPGPMPHKWSPDGTKLAFFRDNTLCLADTLGQVSEITELQYMARKFEWIDDSSLAVFEMEQLASQEWRGQRRMQCNITEVKLDGSQQVLREESLRRRDRCNLKRIEKGVNGTIYVNEIIGRNEIIGKNVISYTVLPIYDTPAGKNRIAEDYALYIDSTAFYKIDLGTGDTTIMMNNDRGYTTYTRLRRPLMNYAQDLMLVGRGALVLLNLTDSSEVILGEYIGAPPDGYKLCDFIMLSFCPTKNVLVFIKTCDKDEFKSIANICMFDYDTKSFTSFPSLTGTDFETHPMMSADGRHISFLSKTKGLCIMRLE